MSKHFFFIPGNPAKSTLDISYVHPHTYAEIFSTMVTIEPTANLENRSATLTQHWPPLPDRLAIGQQW
jgi:hypothetical protein